MGLMMNVPTKDYIVETIKEEILSGQIKPGTELAQEALAERLGVSRMPIREALQNLVQEGFAVRLPNLAYAGSGIRQRTDPRCISYD